jgi:hypothetical protein
MSMDDVRLPDCNPIFIVGAGRSGTTLLQLMINAHPHIAICGEIHYFDQVLEIKNHVPSLETLKDLDTFFSLLRTTHDLQHFPEAELIFRTVKQRLAQEHNRTYERFYRYVLEEYAKINGAKRYGEKTPSNVRYLKQLIQIFPNAQIIHIVRDPRAVVASRLKMPWTADDVVINILKWKVDILYGKEFPKDIASYLELRYEDLVSNPEHQLNRICEFVGEEYDSRMMEYYKTSKKHIKAEPWKEGTYRPVNTIAVEKWRRELSAAQLYIVQKIVGSLMEQFGYKPIEVKWSAKIVSPIVFVIELAKYVNYKLREIYARRAAPEIRYWGEWKTIYRKLFALRVGLKNEPHP